MKQNFIVGFAVWTPNDDVFYLSFEYSFDKSYLALAAKKVKVIVSFDDRKHPFLGFKNCSCPWLRLRDHSKNHPPSSANFHQRSVTNQSLVNDV